MPASALSVIPNAPSGTAPNTLESLLSRMRQGSDFPALSEAVAAINQIAASDKESVNKLSNSILRDFALTNKLLKLANTAFYGRAGGGAITTVSRAVVMLGFDTVRSIALSLLLFDNLENREQAQQLKEEFVKVLFAGMLARDMAARAQVKDAEEAFICSMFHNLGRTLSMFYFPQEAEEAAHLMRSGGCSELKASTRALGLSFEELGIGIARSWGFPEQLVLSLKKLPAEKIKKGTSNAERLRVLAGFSNELCDIITSTPEADRSKALARLGARFGDGLPFDQRQLTAQMEKSLGDIAQFSSVVGVHLKHSAFARQASQWTTAVASAGRESMSGDASGVLATSVLGGQVPVMDSQRSLGGRDVHRTREEIQSILTVGLQDISNALVDDQATPDDVLRMILEVMYTGMSFGHVLLCLQNERQNAMCGEFGFGEHVQALIRAFRFPMLDQVDVFHVALKNNADILITDIDDPRIATRIPAWYRKNVVARTFVILPILMKGKPAGMIYADRPNAGDIAIPDKELSLLKALRNQAVLAIRQRV